MNKIKTGSKLVKLAKISVQSSLALVFVCLFSVFFATSAYADPTTTSVKCSDGTSVMATRSGTTFTNDDYNKACKDHGGYTPAADQSAPAQTIDPVSAGTCPEDQTLKYSQDGSTFCGAVEGKYQCGSGVQGGKVVTTSFNFGCRGKSYTKPLNPIIDMAFALFRFLSTGVGLVIIGSIIVAGIQYSTSRGNPQATEAAIKRVTNSVIALLIFIFMFAILNFIVPGGMFF